MAAPGVCYSTGYLLSPRLAFCPMTSPTFDMSRVQLNDGTYMPSTGINTGRSVYPDTPGPDKLMLCPGNGLVGLECTNLILSALNAGYRLIDTAPDHQNAESVGAALQRWSGDRADVYIVSQCELCSNMRKLGRY